MHDQSQLRDAVRRAIDPMSVMRRVTDEALVLVPAADGAVVELLCDRVLTYVCASGSLARHVGTRLDTADSLSGHALRTRSTVRCDDTQADDRVDRAACRRVGAASMVCVPLVQRSEPIGVLKVASARVGAFEADDVIALQALAEFLAVTIAAATDVARVVSELLAALDLPVDDLGSDVFVGAGDSDAVSAFVANVISPGVAEGVEHRHRIEGVLEECAFDVVVQPIFDLVSGELAGAEALARFWDDDRPPDRWFAEAHQVGLGVDLELAAVRAALDMLLHLPTACYLAVNIGPEAICSPHLPDLLDAFDPSQIVLELTEHVALETHPTLADHLGSLRRAGARLAIDDTGSGFAGLTQILQLSPDIIKLDPVLTRGVDLDPVRRAMAASLVSFAAETGAQMIAEGIETPGELTALRNLGFRYGQGFHLGPPGPVDALGHRAGR